MTPPAASVAASTSVLNVGEVVSFDAERGLGTVTGDIVFHLIEIADGTRTIEVGQRVAWLPRRRFGAIEAVHLVKLAD